MIHQNTVCGILVIHVYDGICIIAFKPHVHVYHCLSIFEKYYMSGDGQLLIIKVRIMSRTYMIIMDVSKIRGTPKWMVYNGKPY